MSLILLELSGQSRFWRKCRELYSNLEDRKLETIAISGELRNLYWRIILRRSTGLLISP